MGTIDLRRLATAMLILALVIVDGRVLTERGFARQLRVHKHQPRQVLVPGRPRIIACLSLGDPPREGVPDKVVVLENPIPSKEPLFEIRFIENWRTSPRVVFVYSESVTFNDFFLEGSDLLVTEWVGGDRPIAEVFHLVEGGAKLVFNEGARGGFEYWHEVILQNDAALGADGNYHATTTKLWGWDGERYKLLATVPYGQRLRELARLEAESRIR
jgi:hypothetical protein